VLFNLVVVANVEVIETALQREREYILLLLYSLLVNYRSGDMWAPQVEQIEALTQELAYFIDCISRRTQRDFL
jgi:hypothetical protein